VATAGDRAPLVPAADFEVEPGYLNTASIGVPPAVAVSALREAVDRWAAGLAQPPDYDPVVQHARETFARLVGADPGDVAIGPQLSTFTAQALSAVRAGAEVVAYRGDFTSALFPVLVRDDLRVRWVERVADLADAVRPETSLVVFSAVQSADGEVADLDAIADAAAEHASLTFVDATQACGWLPLDVGRFDFVACSAYKWLLSPRGTAFMTVRRSRLADLAPLAAGWYAGGDSRWTSIYGPPLRLAEDARRLDISPAWLSWVGTAAALDYIEGVGIERIHAWNVALANRLRAALGMPPGDSAIVSVSAPGADAAVRRAGLRASMRADALRASFHLYNTEADVDLAAEAVAGAAADGELIKQ
jgi:selenocysteine lyase/cysteine desulfurase